MDKLSKQNAKEIKKAMLDIDKVLGILEVEEESISKQVESLIEKREQARKDKDFKTEDKIRDNLKKRGIVLEDTPKGVRWKRI